MLFGRELDPLRGSVLRGPEPGEAHEHVREPEGRLDRPGEQRGPRLVTLANEEYGLESGGNLRSRSRPIPDQRPHKCDICEQSFEQRSYLNNHNNTIFSQQEFSDLL